MDHVRHTFVYNLPQGQSSGTEYTLGDSRQRREQLLDANHVEAGLIVDWTNGVVEIFKGTRDDIVAQLQPDLPDFSSFEEGTVVQ